MKKKDKKNINELMALRKKNTQFNEIYDENVKLQNKLVFLQRKNNENRDELNSEISKLQESLAHYRGQAKNQVLRIRTHTSEMEEKNHEISELKSERATLKDQLESVQCLWRDNQEQMEKQSQKSEALQKLNQQISTQLNRYRQKLKEMRNKFENERHESADKVRQMKTHIQTVQLASTNTSSDADSPREEKKTLTPIIDKLDTLIVDVETGFNKGL